GVFLVRFTDAFTVPTVDLFADVTKQGYVPELGYGLHKVEDGGTGTTPILLIHGAGGELETQAEGEVTIPGQEYARWDTFIDWAKGPDGLAGTSDDSIDLANKFQLWWFLHDSLLPVGYDPEAYAAVTENNAQQLADALDARRVELVFPDADEQFIIMAHGRGGLVARAFMEEIDWAGDQAMMVISMGAPHHGSSFGVADWSFYMAKTNFSLPISAALLPAQNMLAGLNQVMTPWYEPGGSDVAWDNFDNASLSQTYGFGVPTKEFTLTTQRPGVEQTQHTLSTNDAGWPSDANLDDEDMELPPLYGNRRISGETLWDLNHNAEANQFIRKFLLYAGYLTEFEWTGSAAGFWGWDRFDNDMLEASCAVMARFVSEGTEMPLHGANDGYTSVQSALYLRGSTEEPVSVPAWRAGIVPEVKIPVELDMEAVEARLRVPANHAFVFPDYTNLDLATGQLHDDDDTNDTVLFDNYVRPNLEITLLSVPTASFFIASRDGGTVTIDTSTSQDNETLLWPATELEYRVNWGDGQVSSWTSDPPTKHIY
ncbi:MAG: hypothetical protein GY851_28600, partial [bacterium]|nr:hypothetical protein [bacterium]